MPHPTLLHPCASAPAFSPACTSAPYSVLPLIYAQRTAALAPLRMLLTKYLSTISPKAVYLGAPTNGHAHGAIGEDLVLAECSGVGRIGTDLETDSEGESRAMPVVRRTSTEWEKPWRTRIFATRALPQGEKIIVGWEWDDANTMHRGSEVAGRERLPNIPPTPMHRHLIAQLATILHALGGTGRRVLTRQPLPLLSPPSHMTFLPFHRTYGPTWAGRTDRCRQMQQWEQGQQGIVEHERARVIRSMDRMVFPSAKRVQPVHGRMPFLGSGALRTWMSISASKQRTRHACRVFFVSLVRVSGARRDLPFLPYPRSSHHLTNDKVLFHIRIDADDQSQADPRWGPLISAARGMCAVERVRGSGGRGGSCWIAQVLDPPLHAAGYKGAEEGDPGDGYRTSGDAYTAGAIESTSKPYAVVERTGGRDVVHEGSAHGQRSLRAQTGGRHGHRRANTFPSAASLARPAAAPTVLLFAARANVLWTLRARRPARALHISVLHSASRRRGPVRPMWFSVGAGADVEVLEHGDAVGVHRRWMSGGSPALLRVPARSLRYILVDAEEAHVESSAEDPAYDHGERAENKDVPLMAVCRRSRTDRRPSALLVVATSMSPRLLLPATRLRIVVGLHLARHPPQGSSTPLPLPHRASLPAIYPLLSSLPPPTLNGLRLHFCS
ncbi:hypothetical protein B0H14DRAFT_3908055 [Mycena olivaceomarginata]|nr:hypothetical protein B0H14DRAFT_3908055 [Mycena olivaceomarginata]